MMLCSGTQSQTLTILHTNDTHSQVEKAAIGQDSLGGFVTRANMIDSIRKQNNLLLLLDAGDFSQGSIYYNFFHGRIEMAAFNLLQYDALTLGNHEFDNGVDSLAMLAELLNTPIICSNYLIVNPSLKPYVKPSVIIEKGGLRIGIIGLGVNPAELISKKNFQGIIYQDPIERANYYADRLKSENHCDIVICLSHLGDDTAGVNDMLLAAQSKNIDIILGGHTHKKLDKLMVNNLENKPVIINQAGKGGNYLGYIQISLD